MLNSIVKFFKKEFYGWGKYERIVFPAVLILIVIIAKILKDNPLAIISAIFGIGYTILAGKGRVSCYYIGLAGTLCYSYISYDNALYGNLVLYLCYYFPMQILGIFKWKKHLCKDTNEIRKTCLTQKERMIYFITAISATIILGCVLAKFNDQNPIFDAITSVFSIFGLFLTVKRCIEQWYVWIIVNGISALMWIQAYINGSNCFATILMWIVYFILSFYFLYTWRKFLLRQDVE